MDKHEQKDEVMNKLEIYIREECWTCAESLRIAEEMREEFPQVTIEVIDLSAVPRPSNVFATPTYVLNGRVISLGNPKREELRKSLTGVLVRASTEEKEH